MDHEATREELELAAVEPGGLERLMAGDTPAAQAVAAHLVGCDACAEELARLTRASALVGGSLREMPSADLKARTLAAIRTEGVIRPLTTVSAGAGAMTAGPGTAAAAVGPASEPAVAVPPTPIRRRAVPALGWVATLAAAVVLSVVATSLFVGSRVDGQLASQQAAIAALEQVTTSTLAVSAQPDAEHVALIGTDPKVGGSLVYSPSSTELVVVTTGLTPPPQGAEYGCWIEVNGTRQRVGKMFFSGDLAYWVGPAPAIAKVPDGATFGVSLVGTAEQPVDTTAVLVGAL
ncbi:MAG: hypothetical protein ABI562_08450 [Chloroflexota bacterium]